MVAPERELYITQAPGNFDVAECEKEITKLAEDGIPITSMRYINSSHFNQSFKPTILVASVYLHYISQQKNLISALPLENFNLVQVKILISLYINILSAIF